MAQTQTVTDEGVTELMKLWHGTTASKLMSICGLTDTTACTASVTSTYASPADSKCTENGLEQANLDTIALATSNTAGRSRLETVISTVPSAGNNCCAASSALKKASPNELAIPSTSPVERISGPRTGSTSGNMGKGKTASLTPKCGTVRGLMPSSLSFLPSMS